MNWRPSDKFIQVAAGLLLITVSGFFLWQNTLKPISKGLRKEGLLSGNLRQGFLYITGQDPQVNGEAVAREKERLRKEEEALEAKLEQLRRKRESLTPAPHNPQSESAPEKPPTPPGRN
jgi:hypothetical protein